MHWGLISFLFLNLLQMVTLKKKKEEDNSEGSSGSNNMID